MSEPEIARRCRSCGVSIRELAFFCPQCGIELPKDNSAPQQKPEAQQDPQTAQSFGVVTAPLEEPPSAAAASDHPPAVAFKKPIDSANVTEPLKPKQSLSDTQPLNLNRPATRTREHAATGRVREQIQRATTLARDVEGDMMHRVQKVRQISTVVIDEAGYDPSLRFVLVAAVLFILFLVIVLLNRLIS
jgi:hypothetical protein